LVSPGAINADTRLVLTNAIYFKGDWLHPFNGRLTSPEPFHRLDGSQVEAPMMRKTIGLRYTENRSFQAVALPYANEELAMIVFLPRGRDGLPGLERSLSGQKVDGWMEDLLAEPPQLVELYLPRFTMRYGRGLTPALRELGMSRALSPQQADFSGMTGSKGFFISAVIHKAFVDVNEEGTEAAAATGVVVGVTSMGPKPKPVVFRADHPFLFLIADTTTRQILFIGRLMDPE
jgi:serpin B